MSPDCYFGDHTWRGGSACTRCDARLRCVCGQYVREDNPAHYDTCKSVAALEDVDRHG